MLNRRRFLSISAAALVCTPARAETVRWQGLALGAEAQITLRGTGPDARHALSATKATLREAERLFSLYDPTSTISTLNRDGRLGSAPSAFMTLLAEADRVYKLSGGAFDPTIQPLWRALADGTPLDEARTRVGWDQVVRQQRAVRFKRGDMALSLNGIAQGAATDAVSKVLRDHGFGKTLVNIGEFRAGLGDWRLGIADPTLGLVDTVRLSGSAIATSSPQAMTINGQAGHIIDPRGPATPYWSTVCVQADTATLADGLSTALCLMDIAEIRNLRPQVPEVSRIWLVDGEGSLTKIV